MPKSVRTGWPRAVKRILVGRHVPVKDALGVSGVEAVRNRLQDADGLRQGHGLTPCGIIGQPFGQGAAFKVLHDHERETVRHVKVMDLHDMRMAESGNQPCLAPKALLKAFAGLSWRVDDLDGHAAIELRIARVVDFHHTVAF